MWIVVHVTKRPSEAERVHQLLARAGFLAEVRGKSLFEVAVPEEEAPDARDVIDEN